VLRPCCAGGLKHQGEALDAMKAVATAYIARSLKDLQGVLAGRGLHSSTSQLNLSPI
jgi:hypothetical protein